MRLTHLADYAVVLMTAAARREPSARLSATDLAQDTGVPLPTAQKLMQALAAGGLLVGQRGAGGGVCAGPAGFRRSAWPISSRRSKGRSP